MSGKNRHYPFFHGAYSQWRQILNNPSRQWMYNCKDYGRERIEPLRVDNKGTRPSVGHQKSFPEEGTL